MPPGGNGQLTSLDQLTRNLIAEFEGAIAAQQQARQAVLSTEAALKWNGQAATAYRNAISEWVRGLDQVRQALMELQTAMRNHATTNRTTEDDNLQSVNIVAQEITTASWT